MAIRVGQRVKEFRRRRNLTLDELSRRCGLSKSFLSNLENNNTSPSLATLEKISRVLEVPITHFLLGQARKPEVVRGDERVVKHSQANGRRIEYLTGQNAHELEVALVVLPPSRSRKRVEERFSGGEVCCFVLEGRVRASLAEETLVLEAGDSCHWDGSLGYALENAGRSEARAVVSRSM